MTKQCPISSSELFQEKMLQFGNDCTLVPFEGWGHGFYNKHVAMSDYSRTLEYADEFLEEIFWYNKVTINAQ